MLDNKGAVAAKTFTAGFSGRQSFWRYVVVSRSKERGYGDAVVVRLTSGRETLSTVLVARRAPVW